MNNQSLQTAYGFSTPSVETRNRVLRNTYWLLALSMVPTVLGAWIGVATGLMSAMSGGIGAIVFLAGAFGFMFAIEKTKHSSMGVVLLLAFTFFMGLMLSRMVGMLLVAGIANIFLQSSALMITLAVLAIGIFSAFILHDLKRVQDGLETNYITATLGVYLSLYNVFQSLLMLLGIFGGRDE